MNGCNKRTALLVIAFGARSAVMVHADEKTVSYFDDVRPLFKENCNGCHHPGKTKGQLDLTTYVSLLKGGKHGASVEPGAPSKSRLIEAIGGDDPAMPDEGDPLTPQEVAIVEHWVGQGAKDDTPPGGASHKLKEPPVYRALPAVASLAWSGDLLAIAAYHEVVLRRGGTLEIAGRLVGESTRIESVAFSADAKLLAVAGGCPSEYGEVQIWNVSEQTLQRSIRATNDSLYGVSFSPDSSRVAVGCTDKTVRVFSVADGSEVMKCDNHIDWVFGTAFTNDGERVASASRDKSLKLIDIKSGRLIDDVSKPREPLFCLARSPKEDIVVAGGDGGALRLFKMEPRGGRLAEGDDKENSFIREFEKLPGPIHALAFSADGKLIAAASESGEARVFNAADGKRVAMMKGEGALFALAFAPDGKKLIASGEDGKLRVFDAASGQLTRTLDSVPLSPAVRDTVAGR